MPELPVISGRQAVRAFERAGWRHVRTRGDHMIMTKSGMRANLSIPHHRELDRGTLRSLINRAELSVEEFVELLG